MNTPPGKRTPGWTGDPSQRMVATSGAGSDAQLQARVCVAIKAVYSWAGLAHEPDLRPASIAAYCGLATFRATGRIEDAARLLGLYSLDRAAQLIAFDWTADPGPTF
jgi:hypothetical protein